MKKKIVISLLVLVIVIVGVTGVVYAKNDKKAQQYGELVGMGLLGSVGENPVKWFHHSFYLFTNPDPINNIEITKIAILRVDGSVIYEGPFISFGDSGREIKTTMMPYEIWTFSTLWYMYLGGDPTAPESWKNIDEAIRQPGDEFYTVQIYWESPSESSQYQLIGWQNTIYSYGDPATDWPYHLVGDMRTESLMINIANSK